MIGLCHLCGKEKQLTYEHVPPKGANNSKRMKLITGREIFNKQKIYSGQPLKYIDQQKGAGGYTLCKECNNNTGDWYAKEYNKFANVIGYVMTNEVDLNEAKAMQFCGDNLYLQRVLKQILCMFLSTIQPWKLENLKDIQEYVMNKNETNFNKDKYRIGMYLLKEREISHSGIMQVLLKRNNTIEIQEIAIMNLYPLGFILEIFPKGRISRDLTDITCFADLNYNECREFKLTASIDNGKYSLHNFSKKIMDNFKKEGLNEKNY